MAVGGDSGADSVFLAVPVTDHVASNALAIAIRDKFPVSPGHTLVLPRRVVGQWWDATDSEQRSILSLVDAVRADLLDDERRGLQLPGVPRPDGFNVGFNAGSAAGQTVDHLHVHVIPRYRGDMEDPRGGVRHVIPWKGNYAGQQEKRARAAAIAAGAAAANQLPTDLELLAESRISLLNGPLNPLGPVLADLLDDAAFTMLDLVVSFTMVSGLELLSASLDSLLDRGGRIRVITTDYLGITEKRALQLLLDRTREFGDCFQVRLYLAGNQSFHPKSYMLRGGERAMAFVGSANLSKSGLSTGVEWSAAITDAGTLSEMETAYERLWTSGNAESLTEALVDGYAEAPRTAGQEIALSAPPTQPVSPTVVQREALDALESTRAEGFGAGLVVMATGLGKTWLAGFDSSRPAIRRVLFIAHREEILTQTRSVFRQIRPDAKIGFVQGSRNETEADIVLATVQSLSKRLDQIPADRFDYIVVDEFHHATASTYRKIIEYFDPAFLLGLTATPERSDNADLLSLCEDNLVYECGLAEGIERDLLVPFHYHGVPDTVDFRPLPWRNGRFDETALEHAVVARERIEAAFEAWSERRGSRTLAFCVSQRHADVMAAAFRENGVRSVAVHSGPSSAPRHASIDKLSRGDVDVIFSVDMFNEGLDVPAIDTVLLLRPTSSPIVFLQQLGRGLRTLDGKTHLTAIDFIGNHRSFLTPARLLLSLGSSRLVSDDALRKALTAEFELPVGCQVHYDLEAKRELLRLLPLQKGRRLQEFVKAWTEERGSRPTAAQAWASGLNPAAASGHWLRFLADSGVLTESERTVLDSHEEVLRYVAKMSTTRSYKLVALRSLLALGSLEEPQPLAELCASSLRTIRKDPRLRADVASREVMDLDLVPTGSWTKYWRKWPLEHLSNSGPFILGEESFGLRHLPSGEHAEVLADLVAELVDWRIARYLAHKDSGASILLRVSHNSSGPIILFDRDQSPDLPEGTTVVDLGDRRVEMDFVKITVNVARDIGGSRNVLGEILREWFGPDAGTSGTEHRVLLTWKDDWRLEPARNTPVVAQLA